LPSSFETNELFLQPVNV